MKAADHTTTLTVNRGRAGTTLDGVFGAGAAAPTKLGYRRGYSFDGGDYIDCSAGYTITSGLLTMAMVWDGPVAAVTAYVFDWETLGGNVVGVIMTTGTEVHFYSGSVAGIANGARATIANYGLADGQLSTVIGVYDGTNTLIYINGQYAAAAVTPVAPSATSNPIRIGARTNGSSYYTGIVYQAMMADFALNPLQVKQAHRQLLKEYHAI